MLCQVCSKNKATIHYKSNIGGKSYEKYLCTECAEKQGVSTKNVFEPIDMMDGFFGKSDDIFGGLFAGLVNDSVKKDRNSGVCPLCGMRFSEFLHGGKIGCSECYKTFKDSLESTIKRIHGNVAHCGKKLCADSEKMAVEKKTEELKKLLQQAIEKQEYEMAAKYRDEIRELEKKGEE